MIRKVNNFPEGDRISDFELEAKILIPWNIPNLKWKLI